MKAISKILILALLYVPSTAFGGEIIRIKKNKKQNRNRYTYSVTYHDAQSDSLKAKLMDRKYGSKTAKAERSEDGLQVKLIKIKR